MQLSELENYLKNYLDVNSFKDHCPNGLCVEGKSKISKGVTGVSFNEDLVDQAIVLGADFIIVHHPHGFWQGDSLVLRGAHGRKVKKLLENGISLFGFHLPLDAHPEVGNNILATKAVGASLVDKFAGIACVADLDQELSFAEFVLRVENAIGKINFSFPYGSEKIKRIGVLTGSWAQGVEELIARGDVDLYLTGEARENTQSVCKENGIHFIAAGHHQTERFGPRALGNHLATKFGLQIEFVDTYNPV